MIRRKLSEFDLVDDLSGTPLRIVVQAGFGILCSLCTRLIQTLTDMSLRCRPVLSRLSRHGLHQVTREELEAIPRAMQFR